MTQIIPISKKIKTKEFQCGIEELNQYLRQFAIPNDKKNIGKTFVIVEEENPQIPLGYYTVSTAQISFEEIPENIQTGLPRYPIPAMRVGKLAIDINHQGKKIGANLLKDALLRAVRISSEIAIHFIVVDAIDDNAKAFYLKYGFIPLSNNSRTLVISVKTVKEALK